MRFFQKCLKCNDVNSLENYTCTCGGDSWTKEYRILDVRYSLTPEEREMAIESFNNYDLQDPKGILQYYFIPHRSFAKKIDFRIGSTSFIPLKNLSESYKSRIYLKNEGDNPSGCFKDRETFMAAIHSMASQKKKAVIYSSGNAAASASLFAAHLGIQLITCVAGDTYPEKIKYIQDKGSDVIRIGNAQTNFEEGYRLFAKLNDQGFFIENGFDNWSVRNPFRVIGDKTTAIEIVKQYRSATGNAKAVPDFIIVPTGNGSCLAGIWRGFKELRRLGIIDRYPRMVSAAIKNASPVYKAYQKNLIHRPVICDLENVPDSDKEIGSIILAEEGYDSVEATKAIIESDGTAIEVNKTEIRQALIDLMEKENETSVRHNLLPEPASLVTLAALKKMSGKGLVAKDSAAVALISGHGAKAKDLLMKMLKKKPELQTVMKKIIENRQKSQKSFRSSRSGTLLKVKADVNELENAFKKINKEFHEGNILTIQ